jgi:adenosylcobyric acid synthase
VSNLAIFGTASDVGKSTIATAFCRILHQRGERVLPFKAQNMSNNAGVGLPQVVPGAPGARASLGELGRAQIVQAWAAGAEPHVDMNPVLLKPASNTRSQVVVLGQAQGDQEAAAYFRDTGRLRALAYAALDRLRARADRIVLEGAGSCAEVNLRRTDFVNFDAAHHADARVILVADIDRGGVFAQVVGTLACLDVRDRERVAGVIVNRFRGDPALFDEGVRWLTDRTGLPVYGVVPWLRRMDIESEDSLPVDVEVDPRTWKNGCVRVGIVRLPRIANFTDALTLSRFPETIQPAFLSDPGLAEACDLLIVPGSKNTRADLRWLHETGWSALIRDRVARDRAVIGICGGYQMLGVEVCDPDGVEDAAGTTPGVGVLDARTVFEAEKQVRTAAGSLLLRAETVPVSGYEIHVGRTESAHDPAVMLKAGATDQADGARRSDRLWGTYLHGVLDEPRTLHAVLAPLRPDVNLSPLLQAPSAFEAREAALNRLAKHVGDSLDVDTALGENFRKN